MHNRTDLQHEFVNSVALHPPDTGVNSGSQRDAAAGGTLQRGDESNRSAAQAHQPVR